MTRGHSGDGWCWHALTLRGGLALGSLRAATSAHLPSPFSLLPSKTSNVLELCLAQAADIACAAGQLSYLCC